MKKIFIGTLSVILLIVNSNQIAYAGIFDSLKSNPQTPKEYLNKAMKDTQVKLKFAQAEHAKLTGPKSKFQKLNQENKLNDQKIQNIDTKIEQAVEKNQSTAALEGERKIALINKSRLESELNILKKQVKTVESKLANTQEELNGLKKLQTNESLLNKTNQLEELQKIDIINQNPIEEGTAVRSSQQLSDTNSISDNSTSSNSSISDVNRTESPFVEESLMGV